MILDVLQNCHIQAHLRISAVVKTRNPTIVIEVFCEDIFEPFDLRKMCQ
jgi:hypothetical protein